MFRLVILAVVLQLSWAMSNDTTSTDSSARIQGGLYAIEADYYTALIEIKKPEKYCSGVVIKLDVVLGTHHCANLKATIYAGSDYSKSGNSETVRKVIVHEKFDKVGFQNDLAIFFLRAQLSTVIYRPKTIPIWELYDELDQNALATVTGWGVRKGDDTVSTFMKFSELSLHDNQKCKKYDRNFNPCKQVCTWSLTKPVSKVDMGGPLVISNKLVGLISEGHDCKDDNCPRFYTKVPAYREWINNRILIEMEDVCAEGSSDWWVTTPKRWG